MSFTGLDIFDKSIQTTHIWLNEINDQIGPDRHLAWRVLGAVLRALRDSLPVQMAAHLSADLPLVVRGAFYDQYRPPRDGKLIETGEEFIECVADDLTQTRPLNPVQSIRAVFHVLNHYLPPGLVTKVQQDLPYRIRSLWPGHDDQQAGRRLTNEERRIWHETRSFQRAPLRTMTRPARGAGNIGLQQAAQSVYRDYT